MLAERRPKADVEETRRVPNRYPHKHGPEGPLVYTTVRVIRECSPRPRSVEHNLTGNRRATARNQDGGARLSPAAISTDDNRRRRRLASPVYTILVLEPPLDTPAYRNRADKDFVAGRTWIYVERP